MSKLSREQIVKLAHLSRLSLSDSEIESMISELSAILDYVERLDEVDVEGLNPTYQVSRLQNVMRDDTVAPSPASAEALLELVPQRKDNYIKVGRMI